MTKNLSFEVKYVKYLDEQGCLVNENNVSGLDSEQLIAGYRAMVLGRTFDYKAIALQRTGKLGTYPSILGQEAIGAAIGLSMSKDDVLAPYYRDLITQTLRGVSLAESLLYWGGDERGSAYQNCPNDFPVCVPIATQLCHGAGAAIAFKSRGQHHAAVATCGEGATSKGDFLETLNLAGAWQLPLVMVVNNNQWAISTPRETQTHAESIAQKAIGAGIEGVQVDGNDFIALMEVLSKALKKAYAGKGPTLIEAVTYRLSDHTTADDASRYRSESELENAWTKEPVSRLRNFLVNRNLWSDQQEKELDHEVSQQIEEAVNLYLNTEPMPPESMFEHLYEHLPPYLEDQYVQVKYGNGR